MVGTGITEMNRKLPDSSAAFWNVDYAFSLACSVGKREVGCVERLDVSLYNSISKAVEALNSGAAQCSSGICVAYSRTNCMYFLVVRTDKAEEGIRIAREIFDTEIQMSIQRKDAISDGDTEDEDKVVHASL